MLKSFLTKLYLILLLYTDLGHFFDKYIVWFLLMKASVDSIKNVDAYEILVLKRYHLLIVYLAPLMFGKMSETFHLF